MKVVVSGIQKKSNLFEILKKETSSKEFLITNQHDSEILIVKTPIIFKSGNNVDAFLLRSDIRFNEIGTMVSIYIDEHTGWNLFNDSLIISND